MKKQTKQGEVKMKKQTKQGEVKMKKQTKQEKQEKSDSTLIPLIPLVRECPNCSCCILNFDIRNIEDKFVRIRCRKCGLELMDFLKDGSLDWNKDSARIKALENFTSSIKILDKDFPLHTDISYDGRDKLSILAVIKAVPEEWLKFVSRVDRVMKLSKLNPKDVGEMFTVVQYAGPEPEGSIFNSTITAMSSWEQAKKRVIAANPFGYSENHRLLIKINKN